MKEIEVSVVIPIRNEEKYIKKCIESVLEQDYPKEKIEVNLVDGASEDRTVKIIKQYQEKYDFIHLFLNPNKTVQTALNIGIENSNGKYIVRMDAHSEYAKNYITKCIEYLKKTGADNVGGPMCAEGKTEMQKVIAAAYHSKFALGGGKFHDKNYEGYADTVYLGAYKKKTIEAIGLYDENFPRSEDDELNLRILENCGKIFITPEIQSIYYPRDNIKDLFRQYFEYGEWKVAVIKKHKKPARLSHLVPMCFVLFLLLFGIMSIFLHPIRLVFFVVILCYLGLDCFSSFCNKELKQISMKLLLVYIHFVIHMAYGLGFCYGIIKIKQEVKNA